MAKRKSIDIARARPQIVMTTREREDTAGVLAAHCRKTRVDLADDSVARWRGSLESVLGVGLDLPASPARARRSYLEWLSKNS